MNNTIRPLGNGDFEVLKDAPSTAKQVVKDAPSTEVLESGKPKFSKDDKAAKKLFEDIQLAYDALIMSKVDTLRPGVVISKELSDKQDALYTEYDDLVDMTVKITKGFAPAFYTDPQTCDLFELSGIDCRGMTYNEMCELEGSIAFGD
jgi:hypothetical protein